MELFSASDVSSTFCLMSLKRNFSEEDSFYQHDDGMSKNMRDFLQGHHGTGDSQTSDSASDPISRWKAIHRANARLAYEERKKKNAEQSEKTVVTEFTPEMQKKYFVAVEERCDSVNSDIRCISLTHAGRMKQLVEHFPEGIAVEYFLALYRKIFGYSPSLNGYAFPKDEDETTQFKLRSIFWIPDNDAYHLPQRLLFPVESSKIFGGSLKTVLQMYWNLVLKYMENEECANNQKAVCVSDLFNDSADNDELFYSFTGIWFSYKRWGLLSYTDFFEKLHQNCDPKNETYTFLEFPSREPGKLRPKIFLVKSGENGNFARLFQKSMEEKYRHRSCSTAKAVEKTKIVKKEKVSIPPKIYMPWRLENMDFVAMNSLKKMPCSDRKYNVVAAGNIWNFFMFHVLFVEYIPQRDALLEEIHEAVEGKGNGYTVPEHVMEKSLVMFLNKSLPRPMWRRGLVIECNADDDTLEVLDIDTGEINVKVQLKSLRNITTEVFHRPVFAVPVRFSVREEDKKCFINNPEGNCVLGKYLHMMLLEANKGLLLKFHRRDAEYPSYTPGGVWVVSGFLFDIIKNEEIRPRVCISSYLLEKFKNRKKDEALPEWPERIPAEEEDDWSTDLMRARHPSISYMINYYNGLGAEHRNHPYLLKVPTRLPVIDKNLKDTPVDMIHMDVEVEENDETF